MQESFKFKLTASGEAELRNSGTKLSPGEIELLVRVDGMLTLAQLRASATRISAEAFTATFKSLFFRGLLTFAEPDPFAEQFQFQLSNLDLSRAGDEADSGAMSLKKAGYYVSIARQRLTARAPSAGEPLRALVVEDEPLLAKFVKSYLILDGFQVRLAGNRAEVVAELRKTPVPDLVLLDVMLPDADGFDILLRLRQHPALQDVPVIMLTGVATREAVIKGLAGGADGYVTKPFEVDVLMRAINTVLGLKGNQAGAAKARDPWTNRDAKP